MVETQTRQQGGQSPLRIDRGTTVINDAVVVSIAEAVVKEISGADPEIGGRSASIPGDNSPPSVNSSASTPAVAGARAASPSRSSRLRRQ